VAVEFVKSAERTARLLEALAASPDPLSPSELHDRTGYPRSSLHALLRTLRALGWVEADESGSSFTVGPRALLVGTSYLDRDQALPYAYPVMEQLRAELGHTIHYARRDAAHVLYLGSRERKDSVRLIPRVGRRLPAHVTALGQALLAELTPAEIDDLLPKDLVGYTPNTLTDRAALTGELDAVRARGWAAEREQGTPGIACVAVAIGYRIPASDAISCSLPVDHPDAEDLEHVAQTLVRHSTALGLDLRRAGVR